MWLLGIMMMSYYLIQMRTFRTLRCTCVAVLVGQLVIAWVEFADKEYKHVCIQSIY